MVKGRLREENVNYTLNRKKEGEHCEEQEGSKQLLESGTSVFRR